MKYQESAVRVVWIVWKKSPATMYWTEMSFIVFQRLVEPAEHVEPRGVTDDERCREADQPEGDLEQPPRA